MKFEFSAGGVVFRKIKSQKSDVGSQMLILVCQHSQHHGWVFPKGLIGDKIKQEGKSTFAQGFGETKEEAAIREVKEETGVSARIIKALEPIGYWYVFNKEKIKKTVYYYLMDFISGDITKHDLEMENVEWLKEDNVAERLTYPSDKKVWKEARKLLSVSGL
jgi:8-oxo-dGTP diphosphatase